MLLSVANARPRNIESAKVTDLFPESIQENAGVLISFIEKYYEYMNTAGLPSGEISNITSDKDIDLVSDKYLTQIQSLIARNVPESRVLDKVSLYKIILQYYRTRGSEDSIYAFFKLFFNELITIFYPRDYLFELSQGSGSWQDIDFLSLRTSITDPNRSQLLVTSDINIGPEAFDKNPKRVELIYFSDDTWTYDGKPINSQFPYLRKVEIEDGTNRWQYVYGALTVYSDDDSTWPDEAIWSAFKRDIYYQGADAIIKNIEYDAGSNWSQVGESITGEEINSYLGNSVSLSGDASRLAVGSTYFGSPTLDSGHSRVYTLDQITAEWTQIGQDLTNDLDSNNISYNLLLSADGNRVAVTAADAISSTGVGSDYGSTRVYQYISGPNEWKQIGQTITPLTIIGERDFTTENSNTFTIEETNPLDPNYNALISTEGSIFSGDTSDFFGTRIAFSGDGTTLAITYLLQNSITIVYEYNTRKRLWEKVGGSISGTQVDDYSGYSMSLNNRGTILALGSPRYDGLSGADSGKVVVYRFNSFNKSWEIYGNELIPDGDLNDSYGFSVSLNSVGTVLAVGTVYGNNDSGLSTGYTQVFGYDLASNSWIQRGQTIFGDNPDDNAGYSVALSSNGNILAVGYKLSDSYDEYYNLLSIDSGAIKVFEYRIDQWVQISNTIRSDFSYDYIGSTLSMSSDGLTIAAGALGFGDNDDGAVVVYSLAALKDVEYFNSIVVDAIPEFALAYGELINSLENYPENTLYKTTSLNPIIWTRSDNTRQWVPFDRKSFASDQYKLHDGYYWQKYSYDIKTSKATVEWLDDYLKFVHPAGLQLFASILLQLVSRNEWYDYIDYTANRPQEDFSWLNNQRAPFTGAHTPLYQPGWTNAGARTINLLIAALRLSGEDRNLYNLVYHILKLHLKNNNFRDKSVREDYQQWIKFWDSNEIISGYTDKTIAQASEPYAFNNICKFSNVAVIINYILGNRYLEDGEYRILEDGAARALESTFDVTDNRFISVTENESLLIFEDGDLQTLEY